MHRSKTIFIIKTNIHHRLMKNFISKNRDKKRIWKCNSINEFVWKRKNLNARLKRRSKQHAQLNASSFELTRLFLEDRSAIRSVKENVLKSTKKLWRRSSEKFLNAERRCEDLKRIPFVKSMNFEFNLCKKFFLCLFESNEQISCFPGQIP